MKKITLFAVLFSLYSGALQGSETTKNINDKISIITTNVKVLFSSYSNKKNLDNKLLINLGVINQEDDPFYTIVVADHEKKEDAYIIFVHADKFLNPYSTEACDNLFNELITPEGFIKRNFCEKSNIIGFKEKGDFKDHEFPLPLNAKGKVEISSQLSGKEHDFVKACENGDAGKMQSMIRSGFNPNFKFGNGEGIAEMAMKIADTACLEALFGMEIDPLTFDLDKVIKIAIDNDAIDLIEKVTTLGTVYSSNFKIRIGDNLISAIAYAARKGSLGILKNRLLRKDNPNQTEPPFPLIEATKEGNTEAVKILLDAGANVDIKDENDQTPLIIATKLGNTEIIAELLKKNPAIDAQDVNLKTALMYAFETKNDNAVSILINAGKDLKQKNATNVNLKNKEGKTLVSIAVEGGSEEAMKALIAAGADLFIKDSYGNRISLMEILIKKDYPEAVNALLDTGKVDKNNISEKIEGYKKQSVLSFAAGNDAIKVIKDRLQKGDEINPKIGETPLSAALKQGKLSTIEMLINNGADVNQFTKYDDDTMGSEPLVLAVKRSLKVIDLLLKAGAKPDLPGMRPLFEAIEAGRFDIVERLLPLSPPMGPKSYPYFNRILLYIVKAGRVDLIPLALAKGYDVNYVDASKSMLMVAAENLDEPMIKALLNAGADPHFRMQGNGKTVVDFLNNQYESLKTPKMKKIDAIIKDIKETEKNVSKTDASNFIDMVMGAKDTNELEDILNKNKDMINTADTLGGTALIYAMGAKKFWMLPSLIKAGADVNVADKKENTPLILAVSNKNLPAVEMLIKAGADINYRQKDGHSAFVDAVNDEQLEIVKLLIAGGVTIKRREANIVALKRAGIYNNDELKGILYKIDITEADRALKENYFLSDPPLIEAIKKQDLEEVKTLIKSGVNLELRDKEHNSPALIFAAAYAKGENGNEIARLLIKAGADVNALNDKKFNAITYAASLNRLEIVKMLIKAGSALDVINNNGSNALYLSSTKGHVDVTRELVSACAVIDRVILRDVNPKTGKVYDEIRDIFKKRPKNCKS